MKTNFDWVAEDPAADAGDDGQAELLAKLDALGVHVGRLYGAYLAALTGLNRRRGRCRVEAELKDAMDSVTRATLSRAAEPWPEFKDREQVIDAVGRASDAAWEAVAALREARA